MLKKHLSILFLLVMATSIFGQSIPSGTARYEALGYNPFIMDAATDINRNPAWAGMYHNYAFGDIGRFMPTNNSGINGNFSLDDQYAGVNFHTGKMITVGVVLNKTEDMWSSFNDGFVNVSANNYQVQSPLVPIKALFSWSNKKINIGLAPYFGWWSSDITNNPTGATTYETKKSSSTFGGTLGVVSHMKGGWIEGAVDFKMNKFKYDSSTTNPAYSKVVDNTGGIQLGALVRGWFLVSKPAKINLVPYVAFSIYSWTPEVVSPDTPVVPMTDANYMTLKGGIGINMPILDNGMLAAGISSGFANNKYTHNDALGGILKKNVFTYTQFNLGMEWVFTDWLTGRTGFYRSISDTKYDLSETNYSGTNSILSANDAFQTVTVGVGFSFGRFALDGLIGEKWLQAGPWVVSGNATDMFGILSASYNFNKGK